MTVAALTPSAIPSVAGRTAGAAPAHDEAPTRATRAARHAAEAFDAIHARGDRWLTTFVVGHALFALALAGAHDTWRVTLGVTALCLLLFFGCLLAWPGRFVTRATAGVVLQAFCALHIHQLRGLAEMHFFFFTSVTMMIVYQDWRAIWPGVLAIIAQHSMFAWWHNLGVSPGGVPFFEPHHVSAGKIAFHFGIALVQVAVASYCAHALHRQTRRESAQRAELEHLRDLAEAGRARAEASEASLQVTADALRAAREHLQDELAMREELLADLWEAKGEAEAANVAKSDFLARMSHELRTPLNSVIGFSNILLRRAAERLLPQETGYLERILANGTHLLGLINDVLDLSKIEAGRMGVERAPVDLRALVTDTLTQLEGQPRAAGVAVRAELPDRLAPVATDAGKLRQLLINLVGNALKFTPVGEVVVRVEADAASGAVRALEVRDTGIGIPPERQAAVFAAFEQADASTTRRYGGTGLGLAICRSLAQLLECRLTLESAVGVGSTFRLAFAAGADVAVVASRAVQITPPAAMPIPAREIPTSAAARTDHRPVVLVVDDDPDARVILTQLVHDYGGEVVCAATGAEALRLARAHRPSAITLDLMMPGMDGWAVLRALRADPGTAAVPVVVVSIVAHERSPSLFGMVELVDKPIGREALHEALDRALHPAREARAR